MRRKQGLPFLMAALFLCGLAGCGGIASTPVKLHDSAKADTSVKTPAHGENIKVAHFVNGKLGDKAFFDSVERGLKKAQDVYGFETTSMEGGMDPAAWSSGLEKLTASGQYDIIVVGTTQMREIVRKLAGRYPQQRFVFYDDTIQGIPNVYAMIFTQREGSFLAGAFAAMVTTAPELKGANPEKRIGFIGGIDDRINHEFKSGYEQGAAYIDPEVQVVTSYVGDFVNQKKAKDLAKTQYLTQKVDIIYNVAGSAGFGLLKAGDEAGKYTIGVDSNQNPLYPGSVLTSMLKNIDESIFRALSIYRGGSLPFGTMEVLGVEESGIGIARDELYEKYVPHEIKEKMKDLESKLASGEIKVESSLKK
ncbi:BMP family lipoprotein [Bacillus sp. FJAT-28004]|uniref:BMP family lipoprotein n=1 Tax=Bacillus sp. FJAT-28004 TaxID=1679165 RepID=UPI0006B5E1F9|nr:BMP family ABC transporter substrate-binding protein [Bacillus sp. FJAT-28004]